MKLLKKLFFVIVLSSSSLAMADSPLTSTYFADVYKDVSIVQKAMQANGELTLEIMDYLANPENPIDVKAAAINAIGWEGEYPNYRTFLEYLKKKYNETSDITMLYVLDSHTLISLAYVRALDNYADVREANVIAYLAKERNITSVTTNMISALILGQLALNFDWSVIYPACHNVLTDPNAVLDIRQEAIVKIMEYINEYAKYAKDANM